MIESGKDIATRQVALAKVNNEISIKRKELKVLNSFYRKVVDKIVDFNDSNIVKLESQEKGLIKEIAERIKKKNNLKVLNKQNDTVLTDILNNEVLLADLRKRTVSLAKRNQKMSDSYVKQVVKGREEVAVVEQELKKLEDKLLSTTVNLGIEEHRLERVEEELRVQREGMKIEMNVMVRKMADLRIYEQRIKNKFKKAYPKQKIKLKDK